MAGKMTKEEKDRRKAAAENAEAAKKKKTGESSSSSNKKVKQAAETAKKALQSFGKVFSENLKAKTEERKAQTDKTKNKTFAEQFEEDTKQQFGSKMREASQQYKGRSSDEMDEVQIRDEARRNALTKTGVRMPDKMDLTRGNANRTEAEMGRRSSQRELAQMTPDKWLKASRETVGLKEDEKAGVGLGTIQHGTLNKNAELFSENWDRIPKENQTDASIQIIYTYGVTDQNRDMVMTAFNNASTYGKRKIMDAVVQTDGWSDVAREMRQTINNAPDADQALMQQISEDMNVRNGNYLDTFQRAAGKAQVDQYNLQQKEDKIIADWAKENYNTVEAVKYSVMQSASGWLANTYDAVALAHSDLLNAGQQDNVTEGIGAPWRNTKNYEKFGDKVASVGTTVLHDLFRIVGLPISLLSKATYTPEEVDEITRKLMGVTDWYHEAVRNNQVALEGSNLSETQKTIAEITGMVVDQIPGIAMAVVGTPAAGMTTFGLQAGGKYGRSAYENGASIEDSVKFGLAAAAAEVATEKLFTGFGYFGKGAASKVLTDTTRKMLDNSAFKNSMTARILKRVVAGGGEATEEMIMELVQPYLERSTYDPTADGATLEEVLRSGGLGFVVAQILGLPANALGVTADVMQKYDENVRNRTFEDNIRSMVAEGLESGRISEKDAENINAQISDLRKGKGSLMQSETKEEVKVAEEDLDTIYANHDEAREALMAEAKTKKDGEKITARYIDENGEAQLWETMVKDGKITAVRGGMTTKAEGARYVAKAQRVASATNTAERTGYQLNVKEDIVKEVSALSKAFGKEVAFIRDERTNVHGYEEGGKIYVNVNSSQSPAAAVVAHEMTHLLEETSSYKKLQDMAFRFYGSSLEDKRADIADIYKGVKDLYNEDGSINTAFVDSEVMAAFIEEKLLTDYDTIRELTRTDRTLAQKIVDWINKVIQKITGTKEQRFLLDARDMWARALQEEQSNKKAPEDGAEMRYSFGGGNAKTADKEALETAKGMRAKGKDPEEIYRETGWFVGADGKWRFEISNDDLELKIAGFITRQDTIVDLGDVIESEKLFSAYPDLAWMTVEFKDEKNGYAGMYDPHFDSIEISYDTFFNDREIFKDVLVHEIQHAIQRRESFARGASEEYWEKQIANGFDSRRKEDIEEEEQLQKEYDKYRENNYDLFHDVTELIASAPRVPRGKINWETLDQIEEDPVEWQEYDARRDELQEKYGNAMFDFSEIVRKLNNVRKRERTPKELYRSTAGEIEAENAAERRKLTEGQRRDRFPINRFEYRDVVFADRNGRSGLLVGYTKDGRSVYTSSFPESMTEEEKVEEFKNKIGTIFNLGAVELKTNVKKIKVKGDKFTSQKNIYGDVYPTAEEKSAKIELLYDYVDILENSKFIMASPEESYINPSILPKNKAHKGVKYWYKFKNNIVLDGVGYQVMFNIRDLGKEQYSYLIELKKDGTSDLSNTVYENLLRTDQTSHGNIISDSSENSNTKFSIGRSTKTELNDLIKSHGTAMREVFHNRKRADHKELWDMIKDEVSHIVQTGAARRDVVDEIVRIAYETGYINNAVESEELGENTWGKGIYIPEEYKGEMASLGGLRSINEQLRGSGLFLTYNRTKKGSDERYGGLDEAYSDLLASNPILPDTIDPAEQVEALIELFSKGSDRRALEELDEEAYAMGEENAPYLTDIRKTVENAMDEIATFARWKMMRDSREEGIQEGLKHGKKTGATEQERKQRKRDEATMREYDRLMRQISEDERKRDEATMRMHDRLIKEVYNEAKSLSAEEKRDIRRTVREKGEEKMKKELAKRAAQYRKERSNARKNLNAVMKEAEKQAKNYERKLSAQEKEALRKQQEKTDQERRAERLRIVKEEYKRNAPKPAEGTAEAMYFKNNDAKELIGRFRRNIITYLVEHERFISPNEGVVLDENGMEIAYLNSNEEWEISKRKNTYTPSWGLTLLAEKEGIDKDIFFTIYSKIADMRTKRDKNGKLEHKKNDVVKYIAMLDLTVKQKDFLYFDVAKYAYVTKPTFLAGGAIKEKAGNTRGRMVEALDRIAVDMYAGAMKDIDLFDPESSAQIQYKDIAAFADAVYGKKDSKEKDDFIMFFCGSIMEYSAQMEKVRMLEKTNLLTDKPKEKNSVKMQILRAYRESKRLFVAQGEAFERMGEKLKNPLITARYYGAKKSAAIANEMIYGKTQRDLKGQNKGKSLYEIFKPVFRADEKAGNNNNMKELTELVNCRHDIYRLRNGKGYTGYSIEECERIVDRISREHPELLKVADEIAEYGRNLLRMCVESGRISQADYDYFTTKYPYYAPTFRLRSNEYIDRKGNVVRRDSKVIRTAVGGNDDVLPLFNQFVRRTQEIVKACKKNQLASELARSFSMMESAEYIRDVRQAEKQEDKEETMANIGEVEDIGRARKEDGNENIIPWYSNGKKYDIEVEDEALLYGWDRITYRRNEYAIATAFRKMNNIRRGVLTQYNPTFWLTNGIKDIQDMYLYNQHAQRLPKFHLEAAKTMFAGTFGKGKNEEALEEYLSFGMSQASIFEYDNTNSGRRTKRARVNEAMRKPIDAFNALNFMVEQTPRMAVYNETVDRLMKERKNGGNTYTDEEIKTIAAYQASDATLNFGRSGTVVKEMNTYGFTFLNAGVQGMDRFRRMFTQVKDGNKRAMIINICGLIMKLGIVGVGWNVLTDWIYGGDDEYAKAIRDALYEDDADKIAQEYNEMADYQRTNYLLLNINGVWVRIPKGRLASFVYGFVYNGEKVASGEIDALDLITAQMDLASETILFSNPITNNILGPFVDVWRNKDAWDVEIVSEYEDMGEGFHYLESDEETTDLAIKIAEFGHYLTADLFGVESSRILDISPKKLDYLIEQYLGSYANVIMPFLSKEQNIKDNAIGALETMIKKFYIDPTSSNRLAGDYYNLKEEFENIANAHEGDSPYAVASKVFGDYTEQLKALRDEIDAIGADTSLSRKERLEQISELRGQMNELYRQGILDAKDALGFAHANYYGKDGNSDLYEDWQRTSKGADWVITTMSDTAQEKYALVENDGVDAENFVNAYTFINNATADKDENGKSINGSKKEKIVNYLNSLELTSEQKMSLYTNVAGYKVSDRAPAPSFVDGALIQPSTSNMAAPIAGGGRMTSGYGWRTCPFHGREFHQAVDIAAEAGTDVGAVISGTVTMATVHGGYGNSIEITSTDENGNTVVTKYNHLLNMGVEVGDVINQGTKIGEVGSTGSSTGAHLDFRLKINNDWVDPTQYIDLEASGVVDAAGYTQKEGSGGSASSGGYSGGSGGSSGGSGRKTSTASTSRTETKYDSISKISSNRSGGNGASSGAGTGATTKAITGRSTQAYNYGSGGIYLPTAREYNAIRERSIKSSVATTKRTGRTGGSLWDENILS